MSYPAANILQQQQPSSNALLGQARIPPSVLLLMLLASDYWRVYWEPKSWIVTTSNGDYANERSDHVFIYESFLYPMGSRPFGDLELNTSTSSLPPGISFAALFVADASINFASTPIYCTYYRRGSRRGSLSDYSGGKFPHFLYQPQPLRRALPVQMRGAPYCKLTVHVALCTFPEEEEEDDDFGIANTTMDGGVGEESIQLMLKFSDLQSGSGRGLRTSSGAAFRTHRHFGRNPTTITLQWRRADTTSRQLVFCMSRLILFEKWRMLLTALEVHRRLGVNLIVTHVMSVVSPIYTLLRHYESTIGLLRVRPGVRLPTLRLLGDRGGPLYDPNSESEQSNHLVMANECLYEYKASAAFIALLDWDELLVTGGGELLGEGGLLPPRPYSLPQAFELAHQRHPNAAYFEVNRMLGAFHHLTTNGSSYNFTAIVKGVNTPRLALDLKLPKLVVIPSRVHGVWIHEARNIVNPKYTPIALSTAYALLLHMAHVGYFGNHDLDLPHMLNGTKFSKEFPAEEGPLGFVGLANETKAELFSLRPLYRELASRCTFLQTEYWKMPGHGCLGFETCGIPPLPGVKCVNVKNAFNAQLVGVGRMVVHTRYSAEFVESQQGCIV